jgi:hypothetical protein
MKNHCDDLHLHLSSMAVCGVLLAFYNYIFLCHVHSEERIQWEGGLKATINGVNIMRVHNLAEIKSGRYLV